MNQILIPCCQSKRTGGTSQYQPSDALRRGLKADTYKYLMNCRKDLANILGLRPGHDLGFDEHTPGLQFMPAVRRYRGNLYKAASLDTIAVNPNSYRVAIISALYGLIDSNDLIREYELAMDGRLPNGGRVYRWWKDRNLRDIVEEYIRQAHPTVVHDMLSINYHKAFNPWR